MIPAIYLELLLLNNRFNKDNWHFNFWDIVIHSSCESVDELHFKYVVILDEVLL